MTGPDTCDYSGQPPQPLEEGAHGLIPRALCALFDLIGERNGGGGCTVHASYLEIYNETLNDLLNPESTNLQLRAGQGGTFVQNLLHVECEGVEDAMLVLAEGTRNRKVSSHLLNKDSSRSHCLMTLSLEVAGQSGRLVLVDLAGSERLDDSGSYGSQAKETGHINRSLFALGNVISALADSRKRGGHIPYRDSKLTRLLMDSIGGEGRTLMIACISPSSQHLEESSNTLHFASRAKNIQNRPVLQQASSESQAMQLQQMQASLRALQEDNKQLQQRLLSAASPVGIAAGIATAVDPHRAGIATAVDPQEVAALKHEVEKLKTEAALIRRSNETLLRENQQLQMKLSRLEHVFDEQN